MRTTARPGEVAASTGGMESRWPWGISTHTCGRRCPDRKARVSSWFSGGHPGPVTELHAYPVRRGPLGAGHDVVLAGPRDGEPRRELQQDRAQLARRPQRLQRGRKPTPRLLGHRRADVFEIDP